MATVPQFHKHVDIEDTTWHARCPTPSERENLSLAEWDYWICKHCGEKVISLKGDHPESYYGCTYPVTEHYDSLEAGLYPYFKDQEYRSPRECLTYVLYDVLNWADSIGSGEDIITAFRAALELRKEFNDSFFEYLLGNTENEDALQA